MFCIDKHAQEIDARFDQPCDLKYVFKLSKVNEEDFNGSQ